MKTKSKRRRQTPAKATREPLPRADGKLLSEFTEKFAHGTEHFNSGRFFESHESWEEIWLKSEGGERRRLQGLIQIAAAFHHHSRSNQAGTKSLLRAGLEKLADAPAHHWGLHLSPLRSEVKKWIRELEEGKPIEGKIPPKLKPARRRG